MTKLNFIPTIMALIASPMLTAISGGYTPSNSRGHSTKNNEHLAQVAKSKRRRANRVARRQRALNARS